MPMLETETPDGLTEHYPSRAIRQAYRLLEKIDERLAVGEGIVYRIAPASAKILRSQRPQAVANRQPIDVISRPPERKCS